MSNEELVDLFVEANNKGFVTDIEDYADCTQDCDYCPAGVACRELAEGEDFKAFKVNFDERVRPLL